MQDETTSALGSATPTPSPSPSPSPPTKALSTIRDQQTTDSTPTSAQTKHPNPGNHHNNVCRLQPEARFTRCTAAAVAARQFHFTQVVTPDLKLAAEGGQLLHVDLASVPGARRLGGSALAQAFGQIGSDCPDVVPAQLKAAWNAVQSLVKQGMVSAGHDISDGGIATTLLEMAFAGETRALQPRLEG
jgi:hypothetical protein